MVCQSFLITGSGEFDLEFGNFQFSASQETVLMSDIPDIIASDRNVPSGGSTSTQLIKPPPPPRFIASNRQISSSIKQAAPIYIQNLTVHFHY